MSDHFHLSPSMLGTVVKCGGYYHARQLYPEQSSNEAADYGTAAHWYAEQIIQGLTPATVAPNGVMIDDDIVNYTRTYIVRAFELAKLPHRGVETRVKIDQLLEGMFGTVDLWAYDPETQTLYVEDLKFGFRIVEPEENYQLAAYALGVLNLIGFDGFTEQTVTIRLTIHQPRAWHPIARSRTWVTNAGELRGYWNKMKAAIDAIMSGVPQPYTTGDHCAYCTAKTRCNAFITTSQNAIESTMEGVFVEHGDNVLEQQFVTLSAAKERIEQMLSLIELTLTDRIKQGAMLTRVTMQQGQSRRTWARSDAEIIALGKVFGKQLTEEKVISPAQAEKLGIDSQVINAYIKRSPTAPKLKVKKGLSLTEKVFRNVTN